MKLINAHKHVVTEIGGKYYIIDTGSPISFSFCGVSSIQLSEKKHELLDAPSQFANLKEAADKLTDLDIAGFIGMDILNRTNLTVNYEKEELLFGLPSDPGFFRKLTYISADYGQIITIDCLTLGNRLSRTAIDTGAWVSYLSERHISGLQPTGEFYEDEGPAYGGHIEGELYQGELSITTGDGLEIKKQVKVGQMPKTLDCKGIFDAVIGPQLLSEKCVVFDVEKGRIWFDKE